MSLGDRTCSVLYWSVHPSIEPFSLQCFQYMLCNRAKGAYMYNCTCGLTFKHVPTCAGMEPVGEGCGCGGQWALRVPGHHLPATVHHCASTCARSVHHYTCMLTRHSPSLSVPGQFTAVLAYPSQSITVRLHVPGQFTDIPAYPPQSITVRLHVSGQFNDIPAVPLVSLCSTCQREKV